MADSSSPIRFDPRDKGEVYRPDKEIKRTSKVPKSKRDFRKVLDEDQEGSKGEGDSKKIVKEKESGAGQKEQQLGHGKDRPSSNSSMSIFDLSSQKSSEGSKKVVSQTTKPESLKESPYVQSGDDVAVIHNKDEKIVKNFKEDITTEQPNIAQILPQASIETTVTQSVEQTASTKEIYKMINEIVEKLSIVKLEDKSDTIIQLKNSPLFNNTKVIISSYKTAPNEINITFEGLTQAAKLVMDRKENQDALKFALENKGIVVQMLTTTTIIEQKTTAAQTGGEESQEETAQEDRQQQPKDQQEHERG